jgi:hypothetical protein
MQPQLASLTYQSVQSFIDLRSHFHNTCIYVDVDGTFHHRVSEAFINQIASCLYLDLPVYWFSGFWLMKTGAEFMHRSCHHHHVHVESERPNRILGIVCASLSCQYISCFQDLICDTCILPFILRLSLIRPLALTSQYFPLNSISTS